MSTTWESLGRLIKEDRSGESGNQGQFWKVQLAGGQRFMTRLDLTSQGSPGPQFPIPETVDRPAPLKLCPPLSTEAF